MISLDTNILMFAFNADSPLHARALESVQSLWPNDDVVLSELSVVELYRLLRNPVAVARPLDAPAAVHAIAGYRYHPHWRVVAFPGTASQAIQIYPDETPQAFHSDDAFYHLPRPRAMVSLSTIVAVDPFTALNGGTEMIPGSNQWSDAELAGSFDFQGDLAPGFAAGEAQRVVRRETPVRRDIHDTEFAACQGSRLVEDDRRQVTRLLQPAAIPHEQPRSCAERGRDRDDQWHRESERVRTRDDEHRDDPLDRECARGAQRQPYDERDAASDDRDDC